MYPDFAGGGEATDGWSRAFAVEAADQPGVAEWVARLPPGYRERTSPADAAEDLRLAQSLLDARQPQPSVAAGMESGSAGRRPDRFGAGHRLSVRAAIGEGPATFRLRRIGSEAVELTSVIPALESFGVAVTEAVPFLVPPLQGGPGGEVHVDDFGLRVVVAGGFDPAPDGQRLIDALEAASGRRADVDGLNRLVIAAGLDWRQVVILRAYRRFRRQCAVAWSDAQLDDALAGSPTVAAALVSYFEARFDPVAAASSADAKVCAAARDSVLDCLRGVPHLEQDQMLRGFLGLIDATLRTNWYCTGRDGEERANIVLKLDSRSAPELPAPRPHVETFVHGPIVEGVHLRNGPIARGGIRWSDRPLDFRTEVLGLAEAQIKKNAIIVPTGAKGGFVVRSGSPGAVLAAYREFIAGLLDITDNVIEGEVRRPDRVIAADGDDPYLVVAADKGTASFSDDANALSADYRFWLGDAFASGGSHGYDHKAMGITARGAWVAVRRHFRHLGIDVQTEPVRVAGVGDMSGDVFGNGMLQSRALKLVAAFDHRHIFVDPDPDPEASYRARDRLASMGRSSWADYDRSALSRGGAIWPRDAKEITLTPEARASLGLSVETMSPPELISAILTAPVDLLWFGGIGTYVKAAGESDSEVADHANDAVRVTADGVRARVIAEGGNLAVTQQARIRYSRRGGRINTDFIDNAAGVATSDREVNLKILLTLAVADGRIGDDERDSLLAAATDDVAAEVLRQVDHSVAALDRSMPDSAASLDAYAALLAHLEQAGLVDRSVESLPDEAELAARRTAGAGLIRPELAVLLAYAKSHLVQAIEASALAHDTALLDAVTPYFPAVIREQTADLIPTHRLYPQLAATNLAGELVDRLGIVWAHETAAELGRSLADVAGGFWAAHQVLGAGLLWATLDRAADRLDADVEAALHHTVATAVSGLARAYLRRPGPLQPSALIASDSRLVPQELALGDGTAEEIRRLGIEPSLAAPFVAVGSASAIGDTGPVARATGREVTEVTAAFDIFEQATPILGLRSLLSSAPTDRRWAAWQCRSIADDIADLRQQAAIEALGARDEAAGTATSPPRTADASAKDAMDRWLATHTRIFNRATGLLEAAQPDANETLLVANLTLRILRRINPGAT